MMSFQLITTFAVSILVSSCAGANEHWQQDPYLESFGGEPPHHAFPLQVCQGDCDDSSDVSSFYTNCRNIALNPLTLS